MAQIISIHSFRGGTGKSNIAANLAYLHAKAGRRVAVIDTDIQSPGIHNLFGLNGTDITASLNDYLWEGRSITDVAVDVTPRLGEGLSGRLFLIPSSIDKEQIARVVSDGYDAEKLTRGLRNLLDGLLLDVLLIDTHPGLNEETLLSLLISNMLIIIMRPDKQDYEGTGITLNVARGLDVPHVFIVVNKAPPSLEPKALRAKVEEIYQCRVAGVIPHSDEIMSLASEDIFSRRFPDHPVSTQYRNIADQLLG